MLGRPDKLKAELPDRSMELVNDVLYGPAGERTRMHVNGAALIPGSYTENRTYNARLQLTRVTSGWMDLEYRYSATQNNGQITNTRDNLIMFLGRARLACL